MGAVPLSRPGAAVAMDMRGRVAVVGHHQVPTEAEKPDTPEEKLVFDAVKGALSHAGIDRDELDTAIVAGNDALDGRTISNTFTAEAEGGYMKDETKVALDGLHAANYGAMRVLSGLHGIAVVVAYGNHNAISYETWTNFALDPFRLRPLGLDGVHLAALQARRYYDATGATPDDAARVVVKNLAAATDNPVALHAKDLTVDDVAASGLRADPLRDLEVGPAGDGAAAVVLAAADRADSFDAEPAYLLGMGHASDALRPGEDGFFRLRAARRAAEEAYRRAGLGAELAGDGGAAGLVDVAEVTEVFAPHELMLTEALGLAAPGDAAALVRAQADGDAGPGTGRPRVNPSGGALAGHCFFGTGLHRLVEACRQVTGTADARQVDGARVALAHGATGPAHQANAVALVAVEPDPEVGA